MACHNGLRMINPGDIPSPIVAEGGEAFQQQAGERRRVSSLQFLSPPVATRNGFACLLLWRVLL